jgi:hypothetical protein
MQDDPKIGSAGLKFPALRRVSGAMDWKFRSSANNNRGSPLNSVAELIRDI